jgi:peptide chain release factor 2
MESLNKRIEVLLANLNIEDKKQRIRQIEQESAGPSFWLDREAASAKMKEMAKLQKIVDDSTRLVELLKSGQVKEATALIEEMEKVLYLSGKYDLSSAIVSIHSGQGGVEAMDWAEMLFRMYSRFCEAKKWQLEVIDKSPGEEAGIKSITFTVGGEDAYGLLKGEAGVHRLVRLSPFNANNLRQTSFALVEVIPDIEEEGEIELKEDDLQWEFYRASSHGGQNVQKVSSAVRLKHKPTGIIVTAQSERYQNQNREYALRLLRGKLWFLREQEKRKAEEELKGGYKTPGWGNQIRSYVLHPYKMVKDLRTNVETSNAEGVLNGDLGEFIDAELRLLKG